ncbi:MAG: tail fiber domain-containing protein [Candidatus Marinimicrobia bacterium]|nr:tail fiber domain-containing protein [Candidatus Neomarinimicrobiota bacterium]
MLTDNAGTIVTDGSYSFALSLYNVQSGGTALWTETKSITVADGLFTTALGDQVAFPASLTFNQPYWLDIQVDGEQLSDRIALLSAPYSIRTARADTSLIVISPEEAPYGSVIKAKYLKVIAPSGAAAYFSSEDGSSDALTVSHAAPGGNAIQVVQGLSENNNPAINVINFGGGEALYLVTEENTNSDPVIYAMTYGTGRAAYFEGRIYTHGVDEPSDIRLKRNISTLNSALLHVQKLRGVQFEWNREDYPDRNFKPGKQYGFIAQEVEQVLPELVREDQDGYKAVDYQKMTVFLVEALKEQQKQIEELSAAVTALQAQSDMASTD